VTTAIAVYNSEGCVGRCDAKCHQAAPGTPCDCVCGGRLHSCGTSDGAILKNTTDYFGGLEAARQWAVDHQIENAEIRSLSMQQELFA
jgi:hypothetical protein